MTAIEHDRLTSAVPREEDRAFDRAIRPKSLQDYIGQASVKQQMDIFITAARNREEALDHVLFCGPPGLGKTTLSRILANELEVEIITTSGPVLEKKGDLAGNLTQLQARQILFIDEIHRLNRIVEECLYPAMEDYVFDIMIGEGPGAKSIRMPLEQFTLVGSTTRAGMLTSPMRARFGYVARMTRASMVEVMDSAYIRTAIVKGMPYWRVVFRHAIRNALMAPITIIMLHVNWLIGGVVVVEVIFGYPGLGKFIFDSAIFGDFSAVEAAAMVTVVIAIITRLVGDLAYTMLNPRVRYA